MRTSTGSSAFLLVFLAICTLAAAAIAPKARSEAWNIHNNPQNFNEVNWHPVKYETRLDRLPENGRVPLKETPWADSYWPKNRGAFTYRWNEFQMSGRSPEMTPAQLAQQFFDLKLYSKKELQQMSADQIAKLSAFEKYSIMKRDYDYSMLRKYQNKRAARAEYWEGYCHAWAAVASHYPEPLPVEVADNGDGIRIKFGSGDIKALLIANYSELDWGTTLRQRIQGGGPTGPKIQARYIGQMCKRPFLYPDSKVKDGVERMADYREIDDLLDGDLESTVMDYQEKVLRLKGIQTPRNLPQLARMSASAPECSDTNAGALHIVMANQLGKMKEGFLMDKTRDREVWNQPVFKFESQITGYEAPSSRSAAGTAEVAIVDTHLFYADDTSYGWTFWNPTLAGMLGLTEYFEAFKSEYERYQQMLVREGDEDDISEYPEHVVGDAHYIYKLDLDSQKRIIGGSWVTLERPDDLYIMKKVGFLGEFEALSRIYRPVKPAIAE